MEPGERKRLLSASWEGDWREENKLKRGDASSSPKLDRYKMARQLTEKAIKDKKIFSIHGHYPVIRALLRRKGWVEKKLHFLPKGSVSGDGEGEGAAESKRTEGKENQEVAFEETDDIHDVMSRLVRNEIPYFLWTIKRDSIDYHSLSGEQMLNHYGKTASFTTKIGLCLNMRNLPWYAQANPDAFFPRCYGLGSDSEKQEFLDDFRRTAAASILKWVVSHQRCPRNQAPSRPKEAQDADPGSQKAPENNSKPVGLSGQLVDMACQVCQAYLGQLEHEDIDVAKDAAKELTEEQWKELTQQYYALIHGKAFISNPRSHFSQCQALLNKISSVSPQTEIDGLRNVWIVKPAAKSRGRDIVCMNRVEEILELVAADHLSAKDKWVVQKYIETPLLIYDTKFDIRQWFLVTDWNPLTIWFYKESYLRFSTRRFSLDDLDGAIHLCNNSIQKHLKVDKGRSPLLPYHSMWTSTRFQEYLQKRGRGSAWGSVIYPAMKQAIAHAMKVAQDHVEPRKSSFELYGADFILGHDFKPWLIEINSSPTMHASTPVTAQLCAQVQEDTIKVVLDRKGDRSCDIGNFELLWKQPAVDLPPVYGSDLCVEGVSVRKGKKQMPPIPHLRFSPALLDAQPLKARCPTAMPDLAPGPRAAVPQHLKLKYGKV
ncbi:protein monoglycylase TTLL8 [Eptesicus fuscus]|uniref:protein monoglycylase TTLL8 n=1 Tax=Eptesicus fuscus TaxID=29078 RepID=UPI0024045FA0|nr:protein monoglycylase TTLL8 [Eptesicus fuscus]